MTPWLRQRAQVGERLGQLSWGISSMPWGGALVSTPVAEFGRAVVDSRHFIGVHGSRGRSGGSGWPRGSCPDYPSCLWETTPEGFFHFAHPGTQLSPLILPLALSLLHPSWGILLSKNLSPLPSYVSFDPNIILCLSVPSQAQIPVWGTLRQLSMFPPCNSSFTPHHHPIPMIFLASSSTIIILPPSVIQFPHMLSCSPSILNPLCMPYSSTSPCSPFNQTPAPQ